MFSILKRIVGGFKATPEDPLLAALSKGVCPDCGYDEFQMGPHGGMAQNIKCGKCGAKFNCAPFDDGWCGTPFMAERI